MKIVALIAIGVVASAPTLALAHHSFAAFDRTKKVVLVGKVKEFSFTNPHAWIELDVQDANGGKTEWGVECGSPNMMARTGWKKELLQPGDQVTVISFLRSNAANEWCAPSGTTASSTNVPARNLRTLISC